jgi:hypothetical protein
MAEAEKPHPGQTAGSGERDSHAGETERASVHGSVRPRVARPHKGDVGRPETNEEIYQRSKMKELNQGIFRVTVPFLTLLDGQCSLMVAPTEHRGFGADQL